MSEKVLAIGSVIFALFSGLVVLSVQPYPGMDWQLPNRPLTQIVSYKVALIVSESRPGIQLSQRAWDALPGVQKEAEYLNTIYQKNDFRPWVIVQNGMPTKPFYVSLVGGTLAGFLIYYMLVFALQKPGIKSIDTNRKVSPIRDKKRVLVGKFLWPYTCENKHLLSIGTTGVGKSQTIRSAALAARRRGETAIVLDYGGELLKRLYRPDKDDVIAVNDKRCIDWSPLAEVQDEMDCQRLATALVPTEGYSGDSAEWRGYAQKFVEACLLTCLADHDEGKRVTTKDFLRYINNGEFLSHIRQSIPDHHGAARLLDEKADKMMASVSAVAGSAIKGINGLPLDAGFHSKSLRSFIEESAIRDKWIFIPAPEIIKDSAMALASFVTGVMISYIFMKEDEDRRIWLFIDELGQYPSIGSFKAALTAGRKYGLACVGSIQTVAQLRAAYGRDNASTLLSCFGSKAIYSQGDEDSASWAVKEIGKKRMIKVSHSKGKQSGPGGESSGTNRTESIEDILTTYQLMNMPYLEAWVRFAGFKGWKKTPIKYVDLGPELHPAYLPPDRVKSARKTPQQIEQVTDTATKITTPVEPDIPKKTEWNPL